MTLHAVSAPARIVAPMAERGEPHVELRNVSLVYGNGDEQTLAVDRLTMQVGRGEFAAVVGPSGCGKSTLMKLVTGLLPTTTGAVVVNGSAVERPIKGV